MILEFEQNYVGIANKKLAELPQCILRNQENVVRKTSIKFIEFYWVLLL